MLNFIFFILFININFVKSNNCPNVNLTKHVNLTEYIRKTWYVHEQQINGYQPLNSLNCVSATYNIDNHSKVPFFKGKVLSVYNYANLNKVNGINENNSSVLCARIVNSSEPEKLIVAPCFIPNFLGGPYWILSVGPQSNNYEWAIVIGGQPTVQYNNSCTTKETGINNSGLWLLTRHREYNKTTINNLYNILTEKHIFKNNLKKVNHTGCNYTGAFIK